MIRIVVQASLATAAIAVTAAAVALVLALLVKGVWSIGRRVVAARLARPDPPPG